MDSPRYPIGIQTFPKLIEGGYTYVDKTAFVEMLVRHEGYYFLSRPRRFGKSLLLSTLEAYFEGRKELFRGLALESADVDWTPSPVLHFDFNAENFSVGDGLELLIDSSLRKYEKIYGRDEYDKSVSQRFSHLIQSVCEQTGRRVAILIDEYDKPLLGLEDHPEIFEANQKMLKAFFGNLKSMDRYIRFAFLTGVARFSKVSIFSDLNNLNDISMSERYSDICGWTEEELLSNFRPGIRSLAARRGEEPEDTVRSLRDYYDGYLFAPGGNRLYNPFSVLLAMSHEEIEPYWFATGTPTFLARRVSVSGVPVQNLNGVSRSRESLMSVGLASADAVPLMFQTGYLTIESYDRRTGRMRLRFPNREVEIGFARNLLPLYAPRTSNEEGPFSLFRFQDDLFDGRPEAFMERLRTLLKDLPYGHHGEATVQSIVYILCLLSSIEASPERQSYKGRSDLEVFTPDYIYVFEFKYNRSVGEAMAQIRERDYAGRYAADPRKVFLIGASISDRKEDRGLTAYEIETGK